MSNTPEKENKPGAENGQAAEISISKTDSAVNASEAAADNMSPADTETVQKDNSAGLANGGSADTNGASESESTNPLKKKKDYDENLFENSTVLSAPQITTKKRRSTPLKRGVISIIALVLVAAVAFTVIKLLPESDTEGAESSASSIEIAVKSQSTDNVTSIKVSNSNGEYVLVKGDGGSSSSSDSVTWLAQGYENIKLGSAGDVAAAVTDISAIKKLSYSDAAAEDAADDTASADGDAFGFDEPFAYAVVNLDDDSSYNMTVGKRSPDKSGRYVVLSDDSESVYLVDEYDLAILSYGVTDLVSMVSLPALTQNDNNAAYFEDGTLNKFDSIELSGSLRPDKIVIHCPADNDLAVIPYLVTSPGYQAGDTENIGTLTGIISSGLYNNGAYVFNSTDSDLSQYGLDNPYSIFYYKVGGTERTVRFSSPRDDGYYAFVVDGVNIIYKLEIGDNSKWVAFEAKDLYYQNLFSENITGIDSIEVDREGTPTLFKLTQDTEAGTYSVKTSDGIEIDREQFSYYYERVLSLVAEEYTTEPLPESEPYLKFTIKYTDTSRSDSVIELRKYSARRYYYTINGSGNSLIGATSVNELYSLLDNLLNGEKVGARF